MVASCSSSKSEDDSDKAGPTRAVAPAKKSQPKTTTPKPVKPAIDAQQAPTHASHMRGGLALIKKPKNAREEFAKALKLATNKKERAAALLQLGLVAEKLGKKKQAVHHYRQSLKQAPNPAAVLALAKLGSTMAPGDRVIALMSGPKAAPPKPDTKDGTPVEVAAKSLTTPVVRAFLSGGGLVIQTKRGYFSRVAEPAEWKCRPAAAVALVGLSAKKQQIFGMKVECDSSYESSQVSASTRHVVRSYCSVGDSGTPSCHDLLLTANSREDDPSVEPTVRKYEAEVTLNKSGTVRVRVLRDTDTDIDGGGQSRPGPATKHVLVFP